MSPAEASGDFAGEDSVCGSGSSDRSGDSERSGEWNCESVSDMDESDLLVLWLLPRVSIRFSLWFVFVGTEWKRKEKKKKVE